MFGSFELLGLAGYLLAISILGSRRSKDPKGPIVLKRTISEERARALQEELRVLTVRLEALTSLVQKLKASHDRGLITDEEFNSLAAKHMDDIAQLEQEAVRRRLVVELFELEEIEEKLARAFSAKITELNETTSMIRRKLGLEQAGGGKTFAMPTAMPATQIQSAPSAANPPTKTGVPQTLNAAQPVDATQAISGAAPPPSEVAPKPPEPPETRPPQRQVKRADGEGKSNERDVEDELSRIRADVEKLLEELEQMEQPRS